MLSHRALFRTFPNLRHVSIFCVPILPLTYLFFTGLSCFDLFI